MLLALALVNAMCLFLCAAGAPFGEVPRSGERSAKLAHGVS